MFKARNSQRPFSDECKYKHVLEANDNLNMPASKNQLKHQNPIDATGVFTY